jgi:hypothetical protein
MGHAGTVRRRMRGRTTGCAGSPARVPARGAVPHPAAGPPTAGGHIPGLLGRRHRAAGSGVLRLRRFRDVRWRRRPNTNRREFRRTGRTHDHAYGTLRPSRRPEGFWIQYRGGAFVGLGDRRNDCRIQRLERSRATASARRPPGSPPASHHRDALWLFWISSLLRRPSSHTDSFPSGSG